MSCNNCYTICQQVPDCLETLGIVTDQPDTSVTVEITDKFNHKYKFIDITESSGLINLDLTNEDLPEQLINPYAGQFIVKVLDDENEAIPFTIAGIEYSCLIIESRQTLPKVTSYTVDVYGIGAY